MATTESKSGFRLPWSSDRSNDAQAAEAAADVATEPAAGPTGEADPAWPSSDLNDRLGLNSQPRPADAVDPAVTDVVSPPDPQEPDMINAVQAKPAPVPPKKPSKLMVDLSAAIRMTAESAREQALAQVDADVAAVVEQIRAGAKEGEGTLRRTCDEDIAGIKDWSRAEIARIKEETDAKIGARKGALDGELAAHAAAIEDRVGQVEGTASHYRDQMTQYSEGLEDETDPSLLATMAESMPEPPAFEALADLGDLQLEPVAAAVAVDEVADEVEVPEATADGEVADGDAELEEVALPAWLGADTVAAESESAVAAVAEEATDAVADGEHAPADRVGAWSQDESHWGSAPTAVAAPEAEGEGAESGDPVDRGAIMAALEAAAEAVVAAESAAESADQAEAAADVAETAAELLKGRMDTDEDIDPEAAAALSARVGAGGFEESYADRLASLLPSHAETDGDGEPRTTQVVVSGLVSVASIASFKRHLGRLPGVTAVAVASGPDGEFVFNVTHRPDLSFRDALPTMPGFAARVTSSADGVVQVSARDPESES